MHKLGLKLWSINTDYYYDEAVRLFNQGKFDYIELYVVPNSLKTLSKWMKLEIPYIIHAPHFAHEFNLAERSKEKSNLIMYNEVKEFADALMVDYIIFHGGMGGSIRETARQLAGFSESRALIENKPYVARSNLENDYMCRGYNVQELATVITESGCGFCLDVGHAFCSAASHKIDPYMFLNELMSLQPVMYHLSDLADIHSEYDSHLHLGTGGLNIEKVFEIIGSNGFLTIETNKSKETDLEDFINDYAYVNSIINKLNK